MPLFDPTRDPPRLPRALLGHAPSADALAALATFASLVDRWNRKVDLTGASDPEALLDILFADAGALADPALAPLDAHLVDVGAGAGAPTLPLLLLRPDLRATLVEPLHKRVAFLRTALGRLDLARRVTLVPLRLEEASLGDPFALALSRATFAPARWLEIGSHLAPRVAVLAVEPIAAPAGFHVTAERAYRLPFGGQARWIGAFERERPGALSGDAGSDRPPSTPGTE
ncbi:MAG: RsmG family class I SAM-dependent methyltransferase [Sandaracinaceae bacterium]